MPQIRDRCSLRLEYRAPSRPDPSAGLDAGGARGDVLRIMAKIDRTLLPSLPVAFRRLAGVWVLGLTFWLAAAIALFR